MILISGIDLRLYELAATEITGEGVDVEVKEVVMEEAEETDCVETGTALSSGREDEVTDIGWTSG